MTWPSLEVLEFLRLDLLARLLLAALLGGAVGLEREVSGKPAGLRTNLLICVGAALLTELSFVIAEMADPRTTNADPGRVAAQIVSGIGFLGAGTILQARGSVVGLTTAATLWVVAAIGMAVGAAQYLEAVGTTLLVILVLILLRQAEQHLITRRAEQTLQVTVDPQPAMITRLEQLLGELEFQVDTLEVEKRPDAYTAALLITGPHRNREYIVTHLLAAPGIKKVVQL